MKSIIVLLLCLGSISSFAQDVSPEEVVDEQLKAYNALNLDAFLAYYADDIEIYEYGRPTPFMTGKDHMRRIYGPMFETSPHLHATIKNRIVQGSKVIDHEVVTGMNGDSGTLQVAAIYEVSGGVITRVTFIYN